LLASATQRSTREPRSGGGAIGWRLRSIVRKLVHTEHVETSRESGP
jgi:hypothetical protein